MERESICAEKASVMSALMPSAKIIWKRVLCFVRVFMAREDLKSLVEGIAILTMCGDIGEEQNQSSSSISTIINSWAIAARLDSTTCLLASNFNP